jgi:hypothetical protein
MSGEDPFWAEWAMALKVDRKEILPCFCYEYWREYLRDRKRRHPSPEIFDDPWVKQFDAPYLSLNPKERKAVARSFPSYFDKKLTDFVKPNRSAGKLNAMLLFGYHCIRMDRVRVKQPSRLSSELL